MGRLNSSPQLRLTLGLVSLLISVVFVADLIGLLPRPEEHLRESRKLLAESLAVQLSTAAGTAGSDVIEAMLAELVRRNDDVAFAGLDRADGRQIAAFGEPPQQGRLSLDRSSIDDLVIPIFDGDAKWGEVRLTFRPMADFGLRFVGIPEDTLIFLLFLCAACLGTFYLFMRKALAELNPTKAVPQRINAAFDVLAEGVLILDERERIVLANQSMARVLGEEGSRLVGRKPSAYRWDLSGDDLEELPWQTALRRGERVMGMPLRLEVDGDRMAFTVNAAPIEDGHGQQKGVLITFDNVTPLEAKNAELARMLSQLSLTQKTIEEKNRELERLAMSDALTGCFNRRAFLTTYKEHYSRAASGGQPLCVFMVDIDHFKQVNDTHGHVVGDQAIKLVAGILRQACSGGELVGRYGGEEFIVSAPGRNMDHALRLAERIRRTVEAAVLESGDSSLRLTVSIGIAALAPGLADEMALIDQADRGLYKAKETGRNRVCEFDPGYRHVPKQRDAQERGEAADQAQALSVNKLQAQLQGMRQLVRRQAEQITRKATHDELTGLPNRFLLQDRLLQAIRLSDSNDRLTVVVSISLSAYKRIYDLLGHEAAAGMISGAARRIEEVLHSADRLGVAFNRQALTLSRIADNELAVLIVDVDAVEAVPKILSRITGALEQPFEVDGHEIVNDVHCGVALHPHDGADPDVLIRNASLARNFAERRSPRSDSAYFSKDIDSLASRSAAIAAELRKAIRNDGLQVVYQPKVDSVSNCVTGLEALVRWNHPQLGPVGPTEFVTVAESIGVIDQLTDWVLGRVCDHIAGGQLEGLRVSVNVSPLELRDEAIVDRVLRVLREKGVSPRQLEIEITESSILDNFDLARRILGRLQEEGLLVVLDDFGTGYSSLNLLLEIPVDVIKVDRCFVKELQNVGENRAVVRAIIQMAHTMGKRVVAEGVETVSERECLVRLGCREMQGYLYAKPLAFPDVAAFVGEHGVVDLSVEPSVLLLGERA